MSNGSFNEHTCEFCSAWEKVYPDNPFLGNCVRLPIMLPAENTIGITSGYDWRENPDPLREIEILRTTNDFGCVSFTPRAK